MEQIEQWNKGVQLLCNISLKVWWFEIETSGRFNPQCQHSALMQL